MADGKQAGNLLQAALSAVDLADKAAAAYDRPDLAKRLRSATKRLSEPSTTVLVVGEFKQGKSTLVNALLNAPVCPVDDDIATAVPTVVRHGDEPRAWAIFERTGPTPEDADGSLTAPDLHREPIAIDHLPQYVTEGGNPDNIRGLRSVEVQVPRQLLADGLTLVDTPGVGGLESTHGAITLSALPSAEAVVFVSDASSEFSAPELDFLRHAHELCPNLVCVVTKTDFYPEWRRIAEIDNGHLERAGFPTEIIAVSSTLRTHAVRADDKALNIESGFPKLVNFLRDGVIGRAAELSARTAGNDVMAVVAQLESTFLAERSALTDPEQAGRLVKELEVAKETADRLRSQAAKWQQTLSDGIADLTADIDHDFRARMRIVTREADETIDGGDPGDYWDEFEAWLYRRVTAEVVENYGELKRRAEAVGGRVATHFADDAGEYGVDLRINPPTALLDNLDVSADTKLSRDPKGGAKGLTAFRGAYGGFLMTSFGVGSIGALVVGAAAAAAIVPPVGLAAGVLMGRKAIKDEKERMLNLRRQQSKNAFRKYIDEVTFQVGKESRDSLRRVQRDLRDHFTARAEELQASTLEALTASQRAIKSDQAERENRLRFVENELGKIGGIRTRVAAFAPDLATPRADQKAAPAAPSLGKA
jgi:hypothetical protein